MTDITVLSMISGWLHLGIEARNLLRLLGKGWARILVARVLHHREVGHCLSPLLDHQRLQQTGVAWWEVGLGTLPANCRSCLGTRGEFMSELLPDAPKPRKEMPPV